MDFYRRMNHVCNAIPEGKAVSYGQIALLCGKPKNARQVGFALNRGLAGKVPAWRIVNGQGYLTGAASFDYPDLQRRLLEEEGVAVSPDGRVDLKTYGWKTTLEEAECFRKLFEENEI